MVHQKAWFSGQIPYFFLAQSTCRSIARQRFRPTRLLSICGALLLAAGASGTVQAEDFTVTAPEGLTNGEQTIDGGDSLLITETGIISITRAFNGPHGVNATGGANAVTNRGMIFSSVLGGSGIRAAGDGNTVTNAGKVVSIFGDAILFEDANNTLNLLAPSFLGGGIGLGGGTAMNVTTGPSHSVLWSFSAEGLQGGAPSVSGAVPWFYNTDTDQFATFDPTSLAGTVNQLGDMREMLAAVGRRGLVHRDGHRPGGAWRLPIQLADLSPDAPGAGTTFLRSDGRFWTVGFGGKSGHDGDDATLSRDIRQKGVAAGYAWHPSGDYTVSAMAGYMRISQDADSRFARSYRLDGDGVFAGLNGRRRFGAVAIDVGAVAGRLSYDSDRFVNDNLAPLGISGTSAAFDGWFVSPEIGVSATIDWPGVVAMRPAVRLAYARQWIDAYQETGSNADATVGDRDLSMLAGTAEVVFERKLLEVGTIHVSSGYSVRRNLGDEAVSIQMVGITNQVDFGDTDSDAFHVGGGIAFDLDARTSLVLEVTRFLSGSFKSTQGFARLSMAF